MMTNTIFGRLTPKRKNTFGATVLFTVLFVGLTISSIPETSATTPQVRMIPENFSDLAEKVSPAVVNIRTVKSVPAGGQVFRHFQNPYGNDDPRREFFERFFGQKREKDFQQRSLGSGFIIDKQGYIVTNNHVIQGADQITVTLSDEKEYDARIIGKDPNTDLALIKIKTVQDLPVLTLGDSDALRVGEWVVAIGSPFGLERTITAGIVSAKGRVIGSGPYDDFIQTDASINPGNSGGPLINLQGHVVGINTAIVAAGQGIGFAIPINLAGGIIKQLKARGEVTRGWLGVAIQDLSKEVAEYYGAKDKRGILVTQVFPDHPADKAGISPRDIILKVDGKSIGKSRDLTTVIAGIKVGAMADITILRNGEEKIFRVKIAKRDLGSIRARKSDTDYQDKFGIRVENVTSNIAEQLNLPETDGVIVTAVKPGGKGAGAGVMIGDIIKEVNRMPVKDVDDLVAAIDKTADGESIRLFIRRMNVGFLVAKMTK